MSAGELLAIVGPTASGKTELAVRLAELAGGEVVSADSVQIYRGFDVGTGKPTPEQKRRAPHHLVDCAGPLEAFDAAKWAALAELAICEIRTRNRTPILCGGSFLWVRALAHGLVPAPPADPQLRARHRELCEVSGRGALHHELARVDEPSAARLSPNDFVRVSRALEVFELTGVPLSRWQAEHGFREQRHTLRLVGIQHTQAELDQRIATRTSAMLAAGWADEVLALRSAGFENARAMSSVGYRQLCTAIAAGGVADALELFDEIRRATRVFARRQRTWLRDQPVLWLPPSEISELRLEEVLARAAAIAGAKRT